MAYIFLVVGGDIIASDPIEVPDVDEAVDHFNWSGEIAVTVTGDNGQLVYSTTSDLSGEQVRCDIDEQPAICSGQVVDVKIGDWQT